MVFFHLRIPRPKRFLGFFEVRTGTELIWMCTMINKVSGIFGVMAILTGAEVSALQLSMYFYSLMLFGILITTARHIYQRNPLATLSFAYLYLFDTILSGLYTFLFGVSWFMVLAASHAPQPLSAASSAMDSTSGATSPSVNASRVEVVAYPASAIGDGQDAVALVTPAASAPGFGDSMLQPESATSIFIISALWLVRWYCVAIVFSHARDVVRESATPAEAPFEGNNGGSGWQGRLGRALLGFGRGYFEGGDGWATLSRKFRRNGQRGHSRTTSQASSRTGLQV